MNNFPLAIRFVSNETQAFFVEDISQTLKSKKTVGNYEFCVSATKDGIVYPIELDHIERLISYGLIEVIE